MQTYIPFKEYKKSAESLSNNEIIRQRENALDLLMYILHKKKEIELKKEKSIPLSKLEENPIFLMWWNRGKPYVKALFHYLDAVNFECYNRKLTFMKINQLKRTIESIQHKYHQGRPPTPKRITSGYRVILLCIDEKFYKKKFFVTYKKNINLIKKLRESQERFKFAKFLGLRLTDK